MSNATATDYVSEIAERFWKDAEAGAPFGTDQEAFDNGEISSPELTAMDYLQDVLDIEYRVDGSGRYRSAKILIGYGGPNVWIDTATKQLVVAWWSAPVSRDLPELVCDQLDEALSELWSMR